MFVTCLVDSLEPDVGMAAARVLAATGAEVVVPAGQTCCGQPAWNTGFAADAARVAACSLDALVAAEADAVVVPAGSCATMIRLYWPELFTLVGDERRATQAAELSSRTFEFSEFVASHAGMLGEMAALGERVAYHHSCHMLRELDVTDAPTTLLERAGCEQVTWPGVERCCGFGGLFSVKQPETSAAMADDKLASLATTGCTDVVGCDVSCLLQLRSRAEHEGSSIRTRHLAEVLDAAISPRGH